MQTYRFRGRPNRTARKASKMAFRRHASLTEYLQNALPACLPKVVYTRDGDTLKASIQVASCRLDGPG
jgi:hypothetical protein